MKRSAWLVGVSMFAISCSSNPTGPTSVATAAKPAGAEGAVSSSTITLDRIRLRFANGADIATNLSNGQIIEVPVNANLDVWAEIRRLDADAGRLKVNFGNGNDLMTGCGACRLENTYRQTGLYTLTATVVDLNAPTATSTVLSVTVTIKVVDPNATLAPLVCASVSENFSGFSNFTPLPISITGAAFSGSSSANNLLSRVNPKPLGTFDFLGGKVLYPLGDLTVTFTSDKNFATIAVAGFTTPLVSQEVTIKAYDSAGNLVASSSRTPTNPGGFGLWDEDTMTVQNVVFRKIVILSDHVALGTFMVDNLNAACR